MASIELVRSYPEITSAKRLPELGKMAIFATMDYLKLADTEYFVIGGANLVLRGIKRATPDLDVLVSDEVFELLKTHEGAELHEPPKSAIARGAKNQTVWVKNSRTPIPVSATTHLGDGYYPMSFDSHRGHTEMVDGVSCLTLEHVRAAKEALQRPRDVEDLAAIAHFLGEPLELPAPTVQHPVFIS